jgi:hypothetical protein
MVNILCQVINNSEFDGERVFHTVTFLKAGTPGAGMSIHFLKTIGQPFEGKISPDSSQWVGAEFAGYVIQEEYKGRIKNKISEIRPISKFKNPEIDAAAKSNNVPF